MGATATEEAQALLGPRNLTPTKAAATCMMKRKPCAKTCSFHACRVEARGLSGHLGIKGSQVCGLTGPWKFVGLASPVAGISMHLVRNIRGWASGQRPPQMWRAKPREVYFRFASYAAHPSRLCTCASRPKQELPSRTTATLPF